MPKTSVLRELGRERVAHVTNMELFFDLVYVFAMTQLSEHLYESRTVTGALQTTVLFLAIWWAWNQTAWATNWADPDRLPVALLMAAMMVLGLVMSAAVLEAFSTRGLTFALAYLGMQLLCAAFMVWAFGLREAMGRNYAQLLAWSLIAGVAWVAGALTHDGTARLGLWAVAVAVDLAAPLHGFWLPGRRPTPSADWTLAGGHIAERGQLVLMVAFGESMLRIGGSFAQVHGTAGDVTALIVGFLLIFALWSIYFLHHAPQGAQSMEQQSHDTARLGRFAYSYAHAVMVGAVIVVAVAIHLAVSAPQAAVGVAFATICAGGPALFLVGIALSKRSLGHGRLRPTLAAVVALAVIGPLLSLTSRLGELAAVTVLAVAAAVAAQREPEGQRVGSDTTFAAADAGQRAGDSGS